MYHHVLSCKTLAIIENWHCPFFLIIFVSAFQFGLKGNLLSIQMHIVQIKNKCKNFKTACMKTRTLLHLPLPGGGGEQWAKKCVCWSLWALERMASSCWQQLGAIYCRQQPCKRESKTKSVLKLRSSLFIFTKQWFKIPCRNCWICLNYCDWWGT